MCLTTAFLKQAREETATDGVLQSWCEAASNDTGTAVRLLYLLFVSPRQMRREPTNDCSS